MHRTLIHSVVVVITSVSCAFATDYRCEFGRPVANPGQTVNSGSGGVYRTWRSVGDPKGINVVNRTGSTIRGIHIRTLRASDRFLLPSTFDGFFLEIWRKKDGREVIYNGANIPTGSRFFSMVDRTDDFPRKILDGNVSNAEIPIDNPEDWELVYNGLASGKDVERDFLRACPSEFRDIDVAAVGASSNLCFVSNGRVFVYVSDDSHVYPVAQYEALPKNINRIVPHASGPSAFQLFHNMLLLATIDFEAIAQAKDRNPQEIELTVAQPVADAADHQTPKPQDDVPTGEPFVSVSRAYFAENHMFDLKNLHFHRVFFDTPKALATTDQAKWLGADAHFYYYAVTTLGMDIVWAFSIEPANAFDGHSIWSRRKGTNHWQQLSGTIVMAQY